MLLEKEIKMNLTTLQKSALSLTCDLIAFNTVNPPGQVEPCAKFLGNKLMDGGFTVRYHESEPGKTNLIATLDAHADKLPICFTGHLDTVPSGKTVWNTDPFAGKIIDGKLYGRGSTDMKGGVAAMVVAALELAKVANRRAGIMLVLTADEEIGCRGAQHLAELPGVLDRAGAIVVGEPTSNYPLIGHKGVLWLEVHTTGITAHGSTPELGENAIFKIARTVSLLEKYKFGGYHPLLGAATLNVGTISGGENINSVPDRAGIEIDIRLVGDQNSDEVHQRLKQYLGNEVQMKILHASEAVVTDPENEWVQDVFDIMTPILRKRPEPRVATYFTDAGALKLALGNPPTIILGPGDAAVAHQTDEFCSVSRIEEGVAAYLKIGERWIGNGNE